MDMVDLAKQNDGVKYVLVSTDIFSRFAYCQPIKRENWGKGGIRIPKCNYCKMLNILLIFGRRVITMGLGNLYLFIELGMKMICLFLHNDKTDKRQGFDNIHYL